MNRIPATLLAVLVAAAVPRAQTPGGFNSFGAPLSEARIFVDTNVSPSPARPGEVVTVQLDVEIVEDWHIYGAAESLTTPTSLTFTELGGLTLAGDAEIPLGERHDAGGGIESWWIKDEAVLRQTLRIPANAKPGTIKIIGRMDYLACTAEFCDPPGQEPFSIELTIEAGAVRPEHQGPPPAADAVALPEPETFREAQIALTPQPIAGRPGETVTIELEVAIDEGWHLYGAGETTGQPVSIAWTDTGSLVVSGEAEVPFGEPHMTLETESYWVEGSATLRQNITVPGDAKPGTVMLAGRLDFMACTEEMCDPPALLTFTVPVVVGGEAVTPAQEAAGAQGAGDAAEVYIDGDEDLGNMSLGLFLLAAIGWGLFALAMPCTYPMIPITISFFTKQAEAREGNVMPLALTYGLGIVLMFVVIGALFGSVIGPIATHPITNVVFAIAFFVFALALFGAINLQPPAFLMNAANKGSSTDGFVGVFLMGATLVITSFTCTAPFVGTLLAMGAKGGDLSRVILGMAVFGGTMALPFVFLSLAPGKLNAIPRSGEWMNTLKVFLGFVEVAAAMKFLSNADLVWQWEWLSRELFLYLWAGIFGIAALFLLGMIKLKGETGDIGSGRLTGGLAVAVMAIYCAYGAAGNKMDWIMTAMAPPYSNRIASASPAGDGSGDGHTQLAASHTIVEDDFDSARTLALETKRKLLLNFTGHT